MRTIDHVIIHTAAAARNGKAVDCSAVEIRAWHRAKGWRDIGYHWVVRMTGAVETGRPEAQAGAGVLGYNAHTIHICLSGHGDVEAPTTAQRAAAVRLTAQVLRRYGLVDAFRANPCRVLGHREVWLMRLVPTPICKTCPGRLVDMSAFRRSVFSALEAGS